MIAFFMKLKALLFGISFESQVPGHMGACYPVWLNTNQAIQRFEGPAVTGFFKLFSGGPEFHGALWLDENVWDTKGVYTTFHGPDQTISLQDCGSCVGAALECPECHGEGETRMSVRERASFNA